MPVGSLRFRKGLSHSRGDIDVPHVNFSRAPKCYRVTNHTMASVSFHSRLAAAPSEPVDVEEDGDFGELPAPEDLAAHAKQRLRGKQEAPSYNEGLPKEFLIWRGQQVYAAYKNLGGAQPMDKLADSLALAEPNPVRYAERVGVAMGGRLTAEGQPPAACLALLVQERGAELTVAEWRQREEAALAEDPLEEALAELEKFEEPPAKKADKQPEATPKKKPSAARGKKNTNCCVGRGSDWPCVYNLQKPGKRGVYNSRGGAKKCVFCDDALMRTVCGNAAGRSNILGNLKKLRAAYEEKPRVYNLALLRIPDSCREEFHAKAVAELRPRAAARQERRAAQAAKTSWAAALASRKRAGHGGQEAQEASQDGPQACPKEVL